MASSARRNPAFFDNHARETVPTSRGSCELPILYEDASLLTAIWRVDAARARPLVPIDFEPWLVLGKALAMLCLFEYRQTSIGPYGEIGIGVLVRKKGSKPSLLRVLGDLRKEEDQGLYVINLPVTTEEARARLDARYGDIPSTSATSKRASRVTRSGWSSPANSA